jgi:cyclopropane fatty-acyl-phospholipid synthase-like methyltransferase
MIVAEHLDKSASSNACLDSLFDLPPLRAQVATPRTVRLCYTLMHAAEVAGFTDLADGEFLPGDSLEQGIERQLNYLLDQVGCTKPGFRLLELGCGYGHLLRLAASRGAQVVGVNISSEQVQYCVDHGSQAYCANYRDLLDAHEWFGRFDGVIANGSLEHWVQPEDALAGRMDAIYQEAFALAHKMLDPAKPGARFVTTAIHFKEEVNPADLLGRWYRHPRGSSAWHLNLLHHWMGGFYPLEGQLEQCARPYFSLVAEVDGTLGYKIADDHRMARMLRALYTNPRCVWRIVRSLARYPQNAGTAIYSYFIERSWDWQFLGDDPPTKLLRHTWLRNDPEIVDAR